MLEIAQEDFLRLVRFIHDNYGIDLSKKKQLIEGRLASTIANGPYDNFKEYVNHILKSDAAEIEHMLNRLTTNHTYFMREKMHFNLFGSVILPKLEQTKKNKTLAIWSAGCSSGEEPYTLSMILKDYFANKPGWDTRVLATDISMRAMDIAKAATYKEESLQDVPEAWKRKYFKKNGTNCTFVPEIRDNVIFRTFNLMSPITFKMKFDVIFCRNVMIYFDQPTKDALIKRFYDATNPGGYLMIGHSETLNKEQNLYKQFNVASFVKE